MKHQKIIGRVLCIALALTFALASMSALAETKLTKADIWGILKDRSIVYHDQELQEKWTKVDRGVIVNVTAYGGNTAAIQLGSNKGYARLSDMLTLTAGTKLRTTTGTRVYKKSNFKGKYVRVGEGMTVELLDLSGDCAKVRRGGNVGFMYIGHLTPKK